LMGTTIEPDTTLATLINVFTVEPARQRELVDFLVEITENVMRHVPGFVSANIHASLDGTRVVNYAQWESQGHFESMMADPAAPGAGHDRTARRRHAHPHRPPGQLVGDARKVERRDERSQVGDGTEPVEHLKAGTDEPLGRDAGLR